MLISNVLAQKGHEIISAKGSDTLATVAQILADNKIGALMILDDDGGVRGITSERDIVRQIAASGASALDQPVADCMTSQVIVCEESDSVNDAMEKMSSGRFRHLPVMKDGKLTGIVSIGDVVQRKIEEIERDSEELKRYIAS